MPAGRFTYRRQTVAIRLPTPHDLSRSALYALELSRFASSIPDFVGLLVQPEFSDTNVRSELATNRDDTDSL